MAATRPDFGKARRASPRRDLVAPLMLFVVATLTALLWFRAVPATIGYLAGLGGDGVVSATVTACGSGTDSCIVELATAPGQPRTYDEPGLFAPSPGASVTVREKEGRIVQAGWPALADAALLVFLALCFSGFTSRWWRRVLESAPIMPDDYGEHPPFDAQLERQSDGHGDPGTRGYGDHRGRRGD